MSELYLPLGLLAAFAAILVVGVTVQLSMAERRRSLELLQRQVTPMTVGMREQELSRSFLQRVVGPVSAALATLARKLTPLDVRDRIAQKLILAGSPSGWDAERVAAMKAAGFVVGGILGLIISRVMNLSGGSSLVVTVLVLATGFFTPGVFLSRAVEKRQDEMRRTLPDAMDLLTISVEAGLGFDAALAHVVRSVPGALSQEVARMLQEMQLGVSRPDAFRSLGKRTDVEELDGFILAMIQADVFGVSVSKVLRSQAKELRTKRRQRAEHRAMQTPVKLLFPMLFCILPALFVVIVGPGAIRILDTFVGSTL